MTRPPQGAAGDGSGDPPGVDKAVNRDRLAAFVYARLDDETRYALAASGEYDRRATVAERWRWECAEDDVPVDPDLAIASNDEVLAHGDHWGIGLRSTEEYPSNVGGMRPLPHLVLRGLEEVDPSVARHVAVHDPAWVVTWVGVVQCMVIEYERIRDSAALRPVPANIASMATAQQMVRRLASIWKTHPDYGQGWITQ